jgi:calcineurin-like phosphoesterase family protein
MSTFFIGDTHFGEPRMKIMQRPFVDAKQNFEVMLANFNAIVKPDDLVIHVGDVVCMRQEDPKSWLSAIGAFNGRKWLIRGNHDVIFTDEEFSPYFEKIIRHGDGIEMNIEAGDKPIPIYVTHYPTRSRVDRFNIVGHIHSAWKYQKNMLNVGVDAHHYRPVPEEDIAFYLAAVTNFYDDDVWVANHPANAAYDETRGKKGNYFDAVTGK